LNRDRFETAAAAGAIFLAAAAAYHNSFGGPFVYDDWGAIVNNRTIRWLGSLGQVLSPPSGGATVSGRPLLNFSFALNYAGGGLRVGGYHAVNAAIHLLAGLTLFGIVRRTLGRLEGWAASSAWTAAAVALLWTAHPLQTEAVTYVAQRAESLMGLFYLLTLYCFVRYADPTSSGGLRGGTPQAFRCPTADGQRKPWRLPLRNHSIRWDWLSVACCLLGMATKEVMLTAPLIVLLYDRTFAAGGFRAAWERRRGYYLVLGATWLLLGGLAISARNRGGSAGFSDPAVAAGYWAAQSPAIVRYLRLAFWPAPLVFNYGFERSWGEHLGETLPYFLAVATLIGATVVALRNRPALGFLGAAFFAILAPTCLVPIVRQTAAEHRMYLALAPVVVLAVCGGQRLLERWGVRGRSAFAACLVAAALLAALTSRRNRVYRSELTLWQDTVAKRPDNAWARNNLGVLLGEDGQVAEARVQLEAAVRLDPVNALAQKNLGNVLARSGHKGEALGRFREAVRLQPDDPEIRNDFGISLDQWGQSTEAIGQLREAARIKPDYPEAQNNLGLVLDHSGQSAAAIACFREALRLRPGYAEAHNNLGVALDRAKRIPEAIAEFEAALRIDPGYAAARTNLGIAQRQAAQARASGG